MFPCLQGEETDDETAEDDIDVSSIAFKEDSLLTSNYREMTTHVKSARLDAVVSAGLGLPRKCVLLLCLWLVIYSSGIGFKMCGNPVRMGTRFAVLPLLWGWVYMNCELMHELGTVHLQVSVD